MKFLRLSAVYLALAASAYAGFKVPSSVYTMDKLAEAVAEAEKKDKALAIVYTDKGTNWGPCVAASLEAFKKFKRHSVVVYLSTKSPNPFEKLSPIVSGAFRHPKIGNIIPKAVILSPDQGYLYAKLSYPQLKDSREYSKASKLVKAALEGELPATDPDLVPAWNLKNSNSAYTGTFVELQDGKTLILKMKESGKNSNIPLSKLSKGSVAYAEMLEKKRAGVAEEAAKPADLGIETWGSSTAGKTIEATFISLVGDKVTLKKKSGKKMSFSLSLLSEDSQERAKLLATQ